MKQLVLISGGFHPFHPGHLSLYQAAKETFPNADVVVAATNDTSSRPFPFKIKQNLAQVSGVPPENFVEVSKQFDRKDPAIASRIKNPNDTVLIFVRSDKDQNTPPLPAALDPATGQLPLAKRGPNKGQPVSDYLQYLAGNEDNIQPMTQHAYMAYLPTEEFGSGMTSASEIRAEWPNLDQDGKIDRVKSLYPLTQTNPALAKNVVGMLDTAIGKKITEVLDTKASNATSQWDMSDPDMIKFNFTASNGVRYQVDFLAPYIGPEEMGPEDFFDSDEIFDNSKFVSFEQITQDMKGGHPVVKQGIEGTGSAAEVFGIVWNAIIQYVKKARPALLYFQAAEPNRRALYARMIPRILPAIPGYASMSIGNGEFGIYNKRAVKTAMGENQGWAATYEATSAQNFVGGMKAGYQARENQPVSEDYVLEKTSI
jgi:hypothetical protein